MSSIITKHFPSEIIRELLLGQVQFEDLNIFVEESPNTPDEQITIYTTTGNLNSSDSFGYHSEYYGYQLRIRSLTKSGGRLLGFSIQKFFDSVSMSVVGVDTESYKIHSCIKKGSLLYLGYELPESSRHLFSLNYVSPITEEV